MSSLRDNFAELLTRIQHGREFGHASFETIYYLVFPPQQILEVKRQLPAWMARLHNEGWDVKIFSMAEAIAALLGNARYVGSGSPPIATPRWRGTRRIARSPTPWPEGHCKRDSKRFLSRWQVTATRWSLSPTWKRCIPTSGLGPLKASYKGNSMSPRSFCIQGSERARRISSFSVFIPKTVIIALFMSAA